jgi:hypothetical protein
MASPRRSFSPPAPPRRRLRTAPAAPPRRPTASAALTGTYNSTIIINAIATVIAQGNALRNALVSLGLIKGAA